MVGLIVGAVLTVPGPEAKQEPAHNPALQLATRACVRVAGVGRNQHGSGVVVATRGAFLYVLTASHVVRGVERVDVHLPPDPAGKVRVLRDAEVLVNARFQDLALLRVASGGAAVPSVPIAAKSGLEDEEFSATSIGYGSGDEPVVRPEVVLGMKGLRQSDGRVLLAWQCRERPITGRSGGPLLDEQGRLIGICSGAQDTRGYYCHLDEIRALLKKENFGWVLSAGKENVKK